MQCFLYLIFYSGKLLLDIIMTLVNELAQKTHQQHDNSIYCKRQLGLDRTRINIDT